MLFSAALKRVADRRCVTSTVHREARARREQAAKRIEEAEVLTLDDADGRYKKL
jgi:hypothetical protein